MLKSIYNRDMKYFSYNNIVVSSYNKMQAMELLDLDYDNDCEYELVNEVTREHAFGMFCNELGKLESELSLFDSAILFSDLRNNFITYGIDNTLNV